MRTKFYIREYYGEYFVIDENREPITIRQLDDIIDNLTKLSGDMKYVTDVDAELKSYARIRFTDRVIAESTWMFDVAETAWKFMEPCVYFIMDPEYPGRIKIGKTEHLKQRMKAFYWSLTHGTRMMTVLAVAQTDDYSEFEIALFEKFSEYRLQGEWFESMPILSFLVNMKDKHREE